jgi:lauroyl/myristoyl acyltransferase
MNVQSQLIAKAYAAVNAAVSVSTPFVHKRFHRGWRVCRALQGLRDAPSGPYFARAVLASRWRCALLMRYVLQLSRPQLRTFLDDAISYEGSSYAQFVFNSGRPVILAAPHYGAAPIGFIAAVHRMSGRRALNLLYEPERSSAEVAALCEHGGMDTTALLGGFSGVLAAIRALMRNEYLVMMPDTFDDIAHTLAVPFFGRLMRVAAGTAFFALRTSAWIVPVFAAPTRRLGLHVTVGRPIDPNRFVPLEESQAIFMLNRALFATFEREIRRAPEHWRNWERFPGLSTGVEPPGRLEEDAPLRLLKDRCEASPYLLEDVPELESLIK